MGGRKGRRAGVGLLVFAALSALLTGCGQPPRQAVAGLPHGGWYNLHLGPDRTFEYRFEMENGYVQRRVVLHADLRFTGTDSFTLHVKRTTKTLDAAGGINFAFTLQDLVARGTSYTAVFDTGRVSGKTAFEAGATTLTADVDFEIPKGARRLTQVEMVWQMYLDPRHVLEERRFAWAVPGVA